MDKEVIYTDSTSAADGRDGPAVAAHSALAPASVHPPHVELAITPPVEPLPPGNALLKLSAPGQTGASAALFACIRRRRQSERHARRERPLFPLRGRAVVVHSPFTHQNG
ncbi:hypothetical protein SODG_005623 [Sodalis praecaptivus]